jgi:uncharacterized protein YndB with AHSA1/START domain
MTEDRIERTVLLRAPVERVYAAITEPDQHVKWFSDRVEGDFRPGSQPVMDHGQYGKFRVAIVAAEPPRYFAWRWVSGSAFVPDGFEGNPLEHPNTLVEFFLEPVPEGTRLRLVESGFASLPDSYKEQNFKDNSGGWDFMLERLQSYAETGKKQ